MATGDEASPPALKELAEEWIGWLRASGRVSSERTVRAYLSDLTVVARHHPAVPDSCEDPLAEIAPAHLDPASFARMVAGAHASRAASQATKARRLSTWRGFCRWLVKRGHLGSDPTDDIPNPKLPDRLPVALTDDQVRALFESASSPHPGFRSLWPVRDVAILAVLAGTGIRAGELIRLRDSALDAVELRLRVLGKGGRERVVPVSETVISAVRDWQKERDRKGAGGRDPVMFVRVDGRPFTNQSLDRLLARISQLAGVSLPRQAVAHVFRHTYAVRLMDNGVSVAELKALLGHADISTTSVYLRVTASGLGDAARLAPAVQALKAIHR